MNENVCQILSNVGCRCQGQWRASHCPATKWSLRHRGECVVSLGMEYVIFIYVKVKTQLLLCQSRKFCKVPPGWLWEKTKAQERKRASTLLIWFSSWLFETLPHEHILLSEETEQEQHTYEDVIRLSFSWLYPRLMVSPWLQLQFF